MPSVKELQEKVLAHLDDQEIVAFHQAVVRIPSVSGNEKEYAEFLCEKMGEFGFDDRELYDARPDRPNVWGRIKGTGGGPSLMLENHLDTVPVEGWEEKWKGTPQESPFSGAIVEGEIWGRGSIDNKAGMTSGMMLMKALKEAGAQLKGDVILSGTIDEEGCAPDSNAWGVKALVQAYNAGTVPKADFAIHPDCSNGLHIYISQHAAVLMKVTIQGKEGYCGTPWLGESAITKALRFLKRLEEYGNKMWEEKFDPIQGRPNNLVYWLQGGNPTRLAVPDECTIGLLMWGVREDTPKRMYQDVESILRYMAITEGVEFEAQITHPGDTGYGYSSVGVSEDHPFVKMLARNLERVSGKRDMVTGAPYCGETPWFFKDMGVPSVYFGPGELGLCHTLEERCSIEELVQQAKILALTAVEYCSGQS